MHFLCKDLRLAILAGCVTLAGGNLAQVPAAERVGAPEKSTAAGELKDAFHVAREVDRLIREDLAGAGVAAAPPCNDEDFLRRVSLDLTGRLPTPSELTLFGIDPDPAKRAKRIDSLLDSDAYATNWARYWRDVIYLRATEMRARLGQAAFETWMADQFKQNQPWDEIATSLLTATGDVRETGSTALMFAQGGDAAEIAGETSRIFLGIQIQCANCHDHPTDKWKRQQFHQLAAFFPRVAVRPKRDATPRSFEVVSFDLPAGARRPEPEQIFRRVDRNRDGKLTREEVKGTRFEKPFERLLEYGDTDKDQVLTLQEMKDAPRPDNQKRTSEHFMPDLDNPASEGTRIDPVFFVDGAKPELELNDIERRETLARYLTSPENPWFATAYVNRMWSEIVGEGFYTPLDDIGPERTASHPQVLELLRDGFIASGYDVKWLFRTIGNTEAYQRALKLGSAETEAVAFASACPTRLRADQVFDAVLGVLGVEEPTGPAGAGGGGGRYGNRSPRGQFSELFDFDPSTPREEVLGEVPQALFMMNSPVLNNLIRANGNTRLAQILNKHRDDRDAANELYLLVLSREPSQSELKTVKKYVREVGNRNEAFEDLMWSLLNSAEFLSKR